MGRLRLVTVARERPLRNSCNALPTFRWFAMLKFRAKTGLQLRLVGKLSINPFSYVADPTLAPAPFLAWWILPILLLASCTVQRTRVVPPTTESPGSRVLAYVVRRTWHVDIGFATKDLEPPLSSLRDAFPGGQYLLFGFGDRQYLLARGRGSSLLEALWPGRGIVLVTGLRLAPKDAFGEDSVIGLELTAEQATDLQSFIWNTLATRDGVAAPLQAGPYPGSFYYETLQRYSALHTCNTWAAEALRSAGLPIRSAGVIFAGQLWRRVRRLKVGEGAKVPARTPPRSSSPTQSQGDLLPS